MRTVLQSSESNEWFTPARYVEAAREVMGAIDLDPASCEYANRTVKAARYYDIQSNGLEKPWQGRVWLNPPYGRTATGKSHQEIWSSRLIDQYASGITTEAILLVNASTGNAWFQRLYDYLICLTHHRIRFYSTGVLAGQPTHSNAFVYFGQQQDRFIDIFSHFGTVIKRADKGRIHLSATNLELFTERQVSA